MKGSKSPVFPKDWKDAMVSQYPKPVNNDLDATPIYEWFLEKKPIHSGKITNIMTTTLRAWA